MSITPIKKDNGTREYCMKDDTRIAGPWEFGEYKKQGGDRKTLSAEDLINMDAKDAIKLSPYLANARLKLL